MNIAKRSGLSTDLCGTHLLSVIQSENFPLIHTLSSIIQLILYPSHWIPSECTRFHLFPQSYMQSSVEHLCRIQVYHIDCPTLIQFLITCSVFKKR